MVSSAIIFIITFSKAFISSLRRGYISDRLLFYGIFSPKALGWAWLIFVILLFALFLFFREKLVRLKTWQFLLAIYIFFALFAIGTAATREEFYGVYEPFTRTHWEYAGDLPLVDSIPHFITNYVALNSKLSIHGATHPPGNTIVLYVFQKYFRAGFPMLAIFTIMLGGLTVFPLYYFLKNFATEEETRKGLQIFTLFPSFVMFSATSMETVFLFFSWLAITLIYLGWQKGFFWSFLGGIAAATALFMNFLFLLLVPLFLMLAYSFGRLRELALRSPAAILCFFGFYAALYYFYGYSIINNFFVAREFNQSWISSNFASLKIYLIYFLMNITAFSLYLGIPNIFLLARNFKSFFNSENKLLAFGFIMTALFLAIGIFQGETERIWLFLTPLFVLPLAKTAQAFTFRQTSALLSVLFFQIIFMQTLFYTYW